MQVITYLFIYFYLIGDDNLHKRKSKISIFAEEMNNKEINEYDKLVKEEINEENYDEEFGFDENKEINYLTKNISCPHYLKKFKIYFYFKLNNKNEFIFPIESDLLNIDKQYGYELIENIIKKINNNSIIIDYNSKKYIVSLKDSENENRKYFYTENYEIRLCKKNNLKPSYDFPALNSFSLINNYINERISFISKNDLNIIIIENYDNNEDSVENEKYPDKKINLKIQNYKYNKFDKNKSNSSCLLI